PEASPPASLGQSAIERYYEISLYLLIVTGFTTLASTGKLDALSVVFFAATLVFRGYLLLKGRTLVIPVRWTNYLTFVYVLFYLADFFLLSDSFLTATVHLILLIMAVKIFSVERYRDHLYLAALSFGMVLMAAVLTVDSLFLAAFSLFALLAVTTFVSMEMKRSWSEATGRAREPAELRRRMPWSLSTTSVALMIAIILGAAGIFFVLPRITAGYLTAYAPRNELVSGFSDEVRLGQIGEIQQSGQVVMHIRIEGDTQGAFDLKWRGVALGTFAFDERGQRWYNPTRERRVLMASGGRFALPSAPRTIEEAVRTQASRIRYRVVSEPLGTDVFFLAPVAEALYVNYRTVAADDTGAIYNNDRYRVISAYEGVSNISSPAATALRAAAGEVPQEIQERYLQLPAKVDARIPPLAQQITAKAANDYDRARALELYLQARYGYTLQLSKEPLADPVANFLFERKEGHCEYFASSMAIMLRELGIPARIVNGFRTGEFNDLTGSYIIRARDAHSWVEAYFPGQGWVAFDPTPASNRSAATGWQRVLLYFDAMSEFWREWVVNYDFSHQNTLGQSMTLSSRQYFVNFQRWMRRKYEALLDSARETRRRAQEQPREWGMRGVLALSGLLLLINTRKLWRGARRQWLARRPGRAPQAAASIWYERMTRALARRGWPRQPAQTPEEFLITIDDPRARGSVEAFIERYQRARFGDSAEDAQQLPELYESIRSGQ
ncbi:MAG: transglutaminase TgpA family protein, partial [Terriglobales bacterium]